MGVMEEARSSMERALPAASLEGLAADPGFGSSLAEALARGRVRVPGGTPADICCIVVYSPSRGAISDLAAIAPQWSGNALPVVVALSALSEAKQQALRDTGLAFVDRAGNAWIEAPGVIVDRRGMEAPSTEAGRGKGKAAAGVFSDKATIVTRLLMDGRALGVRELSAAADDAGCSLSPGFASKVVRSLEEERYARRSGGKVLLVNRSGLLADWVEAYRGMRHPRPAGWYLHAAGAENARGAVGRAVGDAGALAGLAAASLGGCYAMFDAVDVYARDLAAVEAALEAAGAVRVERGANVNVSVPRYKASAFFGAREADGIRVTSDLQTYLDLQLQPRRGREAAEHLMETRLAPLLDEGRTTA